MTAGVTADLVGGRYRLESLIGRGGMGDVWAGEDVRLRRKVAVKLLRTDRAADPRFRGRFEREAHLAAQVNHPNVVAIFDIGERDGVPYMVMERLPGRTLADAIAAGPLDASTARRFTVQVLEALRAAHAAGVLHRDIKPSNILLTTEGNAKVADFGIAKAIEPADLTATGELLGTPAYLAPERVEGAAATVASDIYSVGVVLYEMLTATKPFDAETPFAVLHAIANRPVTPVTDLRAGAPTDLVHAASIAMSHVPTERYPSATSMLAAIAPDVDADHIAAATTEPILTSSAVQPTERLDDAPRPQLPPIAESQRRVGAFVAAAIATAVIASLVAVAIVTTRGDTAPPGRPSATSAPVQNATVVSPPTTTIAPTPTTVATPRKQEKRHGGQRHGNGAGD